MSKEYIPFEDFVPYAEDLVAGEQIHINHDNCTAGADTKRRLYIKRTEDDRTLLAYCHNCGLHGCYSETKFRYAKATIRSGVAGSSGTAEIEAGGRSRTNIPADVTPTFGDWNPRARAWISKYGITPLEISKYKLMYSESQDSIIFPVYRAGELLGYQMRPFKEDMPKYITRTKHKPLWWYSGDYALQSSASTGICLVEDVVSGIKCARYTPTIALLGANLHDDIAAFALRNNESFAFTVFLDDDNRQVKLSQLNIKRKLEQAGYHVRLITGMGKDPKKCSDKELKEVLINA